MAMIRVIPATAPVMSAQSKSISHKRRVAAYARVSTDSEEQLTSYEAQVDYYTKFIKNRADWDFVTVYTDEGISAVNTSRREGFKRMVADGLSGKFDLLVTKSVSRFARNTVDSLTTVRKLKERGIEVWFEKENIYTLDSKGELLITIMSSLAQEESRSISENVTWGQRKRMADGRFNLPYKQFLGYRRGEDGLPQIVPEEAETIRLIYRLFMEGKSYNAIATTLTANGILTPAGKEKWQWCGIRSILTNEKYKGHALLQKTYCADFLAKKMVKNTGQVQQYYVENSHPAIIEPDEWDAVQAEIERRKGLNFVGRSENIFTGKIVCGECGNLYWKKTWGSYRDKRGQGRKEVYVCSNRQKEKEPARRCRTPYFTECELKKRFLEAFNKLMENRTGLIADCRMAMSALCNTAEIDKEMSELQGEIEVMDNLMHKAIRESTHNLAEPGKCSETYAERQLKASERLTELEEERRNRLAKSKRLSRFIKDIKERPLILTEFDEALWLAVVEKATVATDGTITFSFRNGSEVTV